MSDTSSEDVVMVEHPPELKDEHDKVGSLDGPSPKQPKIDNEDAPKQPKPKEQPSQQVVVSSKDDRSGGARADGPAGLVDGGSAVQIVSIGSKENAYAFSFAQDRLNPILASIPPGYKVAVVSVVGAFRTGKSFLLSWFLRFLHHLQESQKGSGSASAAAGAASAASSTNDGSSSKPWYEQFDSLGNNDGFAWRGGAERNTTGIWMWSVPYFIRVPDQNQPVAVLLVDTQGMFDNETTMELTASIFGFSTLLSSKQIYNVDKRIQEDNLQHLALFSEYARSASEQEKKHKEEEENVGKDIPVEDKPKDDEGKGEVEDDEGKGDEDKSEGQKKPGKEDYDSRKDGKVEEEDPAKPFQSIEFLVRDWQHFDDDDDDDDNEDDDDDSPNLEKMETDMAKHLDKVIADRDAKDLQDTREQIRSCFDQISCFGLPHPGMAVTKKKYKGEVKSIEKLFLLLLDRYCRRVFDPKALSPKVIRGRELSAAELGTYIRAYVELFCGGAKFPDATTMLEATSTANNTNAVQLAVEEYKQSMDRVAGPTCDNFVKPGLLEDEHLRISTRAMEAFNDVATFGSRRLIQQSRDKLVTQIEANYATYRSLNENRDPLKGWETWLLPGLIAFFSWITKWIINLSCSNSVCQAGSDLFGFSRAVAIFFMLIYSATRAEQVRESLSKFKGAVELFMGDSGTVKVGAAASAGDGGKLKKE